MSPTESVSDENVSPGNIFWSEAIRLLRRPNLSINALYLSSLFCSSSAAAILSALSFFVLRTSGGTYTFVTPPTVNEPDSIKYVVSDSKGCRITWNDEQGLPHVEQVQNLKSFTKKVKAVTGVEYMIQCQNSGLSYSYLYLNDSLVDADQASDFVHGCFSQWTYQ